MRFGDHSGKTSNRFCHNLVTALKVCLVIGLFWYMIHKGLISPERIKSLFSAKLFPAFLTAALMCLASYLLAALRQKILLRTIDIRLSLLQSFYIVYVGVFFNNVFPGSTGGDVTRLYLLGKDNREAISNIAGFALFDRIVGFSAVTVTAAVAMGYTLAWEGSRLQGEWSGLLWVVLFACLAPFVFFAALFFGRIPFIRISARRMFSLLPKSAWIVDFLLTLEGFTRRKDVIAWAFVISILSCSVQLVGVTVLSWALFGVNGIFPALVTTPIVMLSGVIPFTPGNIGGSEYLASLLWDLFGAAGGGTLWASFRVVIVTTSLLGGIVYLFRFRGARRSDFSRAVDGNKPQPMPKRHENP